MDPMIFDGLSRFPEVIHGVFPRQGGVSLPPFDSLNLGFAPGDDEKAVAENRKRVLGHLGFSTAQFLSQVHGKDILVQDRHSPQPELFWRPDRPFPVSTVAADGVISDMPGLALVIQVADCQAVLLYDPEKRVVANVHSGWRGSVQNIVGQSIDVMQSCFGCDPAGIRAGISPSLGPCCAEFVHYKKEIPKIYWKYKDPHRPYFDFRAITRDQLVEKGVLEQHIDGMNRCTKCESERFFSYRKEGVTGRFGAVIGLR